MLWALARSWPTNPNHADAMNKTSYVSLKLTELETALVLNALKHSRDRCETQGWIATAAEEKAFFKTRLAEFEDLICSHGQPGKVTYSEHNYHLVRSSLNQARDGLFVNWRAATVADVKAGYIKRVEEIDALIARYDQGLINEQSGDPDADEDLEEETA